jgi:tetratricopeptide (TPR) repeat protein
MTQQDLADRAGMSVRGIGKIEAGRVGVPRPATVRLLADALDLVGEDRDRFCRSAALPALPALVPMTSVAAQLPADVRGFTGRAAEVAQLDKTLVIDSAGEDAAAVVISAVAGTAGVGKTALAIHWAHRVVDRFPDGQLYVNLRGYDPAHPMSAADALAWLLTSLGVPARELPLEIPQRAARYRSEVAGRRMLILLDNASSVEQVRPLLPGTNTCVVVVTSRDSLAGLVVLDGAQRLELQPLPRVDAVGLLRRLVGGRAEAEPAAVEALARLCVRLPLALRVAAELAAYRPAVTLSELVHELNDQHRRLELFDASGDPKAAVTAVFSWSLRHLAADAAHAFALLSLHPGPDLDAYAAAALADISLQQARQILDQLARSHLIHSTTPGRYGMHDLLRAYASRLVTENTGPGGPRPALNRLTDYYLTTSGIAMDRLFPAEAHRRPLIHPPRTPAPTLATMDAARTWLDMERSTLIAIAAHAAKAADHDGMGPTVELSKILYRYLDGGHYNDALALHAYAQDAAQRMGDLAGQAQAILGLGVIHQRLSQHASAIKYYQRALALFTQVADPVGQARAFGNLGLVEDRLGHYDTAAEYHRKALIRYRHADDHVGAAYAVMHLSLINQRHGRLLLARAGHQQALTLFRTINDVTGMAYALNNLGTVEGQLGQLAAAVDHQHEALHLFQTLGHQFGQAWTLDSLGTISTSSGDPDNALELHQQALAIFQVLRDSDSQAVSLNGIGEAAQAAQRPRDAIEHHTAALTLAATTGNLEQQRRAHTGLGHTFHTLGDATTARRHFHQADAFRASPETLKTNPEHAVPAAIEELDQLNHNSAAGRRCRP